MSQYILHKKNPLPAIIESVEPGSIGDELGFEPGDKLISINHIKPRDLIDYRFLIAEEELHLEVMDQNGNIHELDIEKNSDDGLGLIFTKVLFDGLKQCNNNCPFCFIDQQPPGKRKTLYIKDDDYRMSFLYGSYLTLTNLNQTDWERIEQQRLSPLYVSVHATDPYLRTQLLRNPKAIHLIEQLKWFKKRNLQIHAQIVVCPDINDGKSLEKTLTDLFTFGQGDWPVVLSTAVVPVGLTRFRPEDDGLKPVNTICAKKVIDQVEKLQHHFKKITRSNFAWLSDEWYLIANRALPILDSYENLPQEENGVGSIRSFLNAINNATKLLPKTINSPRTCTWVVGKLVENSLKDACNRLNQIDGLTVNLVGLPSPYWGQEQVVTGLLTGKDLVEGLKGIDLGEEILLPSVMLRKNQTIFLDDMELQELKNSLNISIRVVYGAEDVIAAALGE